MRGYIKKGYSQSDINEWEQDLFSNYSNSTKKSSRSFFKKFFGWFKFKTGITKKSPRSHWKKGNRRVWWSRGSLPSYHKNYYR